MRTKVVIEIEHPDDLTNINEEAIRETFDEAGDMDWKIVSISIEQSE